MAGETTLSRATARAAKTVDFSNTTVLAGAKKKKKKYRVIVALSFSLS